MQLVIDQGLFFCINKCFLVYFFGTVNLNRPRVRDTEQSSDARQISCSCPWHRSQDFNMDSGSHDFIMDSESQDFNKATMKQIKNNVFQAWWLSV